MNGKELMNHAGGHLPFEKAVNDLLEINKVNIITVAVNNTLSPITLPPGTLTFHTNDPRYKFYFLHIHNIIYKWEIFDSS